MLLNQFENRFPTEESCMDYYWLSAKEVQHQLHISQYPPVWFMMMKLRNIMGKRENIYRLTGTVELDEAFFPRRMEADKKSSPCQTVRPPT